jgi:hypothetical protein
METPQEEKPIVFFYVRHNGLCLRQGEIISNLCEFKLQIPEEKTIESIKEPKFDPIYHTYVIVVSQDCDLEWDHKARLQEASEHKLLTHVLFCALFPREEIKDESKRKSQEFNRIKDNQNERYHYLSAAPVNGGENSLPELVVDFKTTFSLPTEFVYWLLTTGQTIRKGALSSPYLEDCMHRLYSFLGRVAIPSAVLPLTTN